jgi:ABC-type polysaccharide/polyol phosphate export permease
LPLTPAAELLRTTLTGNGFNWRLAAVLGGWSVVLFTLGWLRLKMLDG